MHSLETGIILAITMFFILRFLTFTFEKEVNISNEIGQKVNTEQLGYKISGNKFYKPETLKDILSIINDKGKKYERINE